MYLFQTIQGGPTANGVWWLPLWLWQWLSSPSCLWPFIWAEKSQRRESSRGSCLFLPILKKWRIKLTKPDPPVFPWLNTCFNFILISMFLCIIMSVRVSIFFIGVFVRHQPWLYRIYVGISNLPSLPPTEREQARKVTSPVFSFMCALALRTLHDFWARGRFIVYNTYVMLVLTIKGNRDF